jgi:hypothetical protein
LNSAFTTMCWLKPKLRWGSCEKFLGSGESSQPAGSDEVLLSFGEYELFVDVDVPLGSASSFCFCRAALLLLCRLCDVSVVVCCNIRLAGILEALAATSTGRSVGMAMIVMMLDEF